MKKLLLLTAALAMLLAGCCNGNKAQDANEAAINTIMNRKSVRSYTDQKLTEQQIETLLKAAMAAPSAINIQPWSFVVIDDDAVKQAIWGEGFQSKLFISAPVVVVDCSAATENLLLAAEAMGLGAVWTAIYPTERMARVCEKLGLPANVKPLCAVPIGYPAGDDQPKDKWKPEKIHRNRW